MEKKVLDLWDYVCIEDENNLLDLCNNELVESLVNLNDLFTNAEDEDIQSCFDSMNKIICVIGILLRLRKVMKDYYKGKFADRPIL